MWCRLKSLGHCQRLCLRSCEIGDWITGLARRVYHSTTGSSPPEPVVEIPHFDDPIFN